jgi:putative transport protein
MTWLSSLLFSGHGVANGVFVLSLVAVLGLAVGEIKIGPVKLGIAGPLFVGIAFGHFGFQMEKPILEFAREFGLILFVYAIGITVGPGFFQSFKKDGALLNALAAGIVVMGGIITVLIYYWVGLPLEVVVGMFSGATTNTPSLAAGQQMLTELKATADQIVKPGLGYAVAYPFGVVGILLTMGLLRAMFRVTPKTEADQWERDRRANLKPVDTMNIEVRNPAGDHVAIHDLPVVRDGGVIISRVMHAGAQHTRGGGDLLEIADVVLAVGPRKRLEDLRDVLGVEAPMKLQEASSPIRTVNIVATRTNVLGKRIFDLHFLDTHGVVITRLNRAGVELVPDKSVKLQFGDFLTCVGEEKQLEIVSAIVGNERKSLNTAQIIPIFIGILLGVLVGSIPFFIPGLPAPIQLGLAGGPVVVAIILARIGNIGPLVWFMPPGTTNAIREIGITMFMSCVGIYAGKTFIATVVHGDGLLWMACATIITFVPIFIVGLIARGIFKMNYLTTCGLLAGSCTDPPALSFANAITPSEAQATAYATVYPLTMCLRILTPQIILALLWAVS